MRSSWKRTGSLFVAIAILNAVPFMFGASARHRDVVDRNDAPGPLDIRRVEVTRASNSRWRVITWNRWSTERIWDAGYVLVYLDTFGDERFDYYALARSTGGGMEAFLYRDRQGKPDRRLARLGVSRPNNRSLKIKLRFGKMRFRSGQAFKYRWYAETLTTVAKCPRVCFDRAPDSGAIREPRRQPVPTPTITLTPTPTITPTGTPTETPTP